VPIPLLPLTTVQTILHKFIDNEAEESEDGSTSGADDDEESNSVQEGFIHDDSDIDVQFVEDSRWPPVSDGFDINESYQVDRIIVMYQLMRDSFGTTQVGGRQLTVLDALREVSRPGYVLQLHANRF
jgi:hypothetical protein